MYYYSSMDSHTENPQPYQIDINNCSHAADILPPSGQKKSGHKNQKGTSKAVKFGILEDEGYPTMQALEMAGYTGATRGRDVRKTSDYQQYKDDLRRERAGLSRRKGYTLTDSARMYAGMSKKAMTDSNKIRARECLDKLLGYFAPVEISADHDSQGDRPVIQFLQVLQEYKVSPLDLLRMAQTEALKPDCISAMIPPMPRMEANLSTSPLNKMSHNIIYVNHDVDSEAIQDDQTKAIDTGEE
jgi:hypothetical protein